MLKKATLKTARLLATGTFVLLASHAAFAQTPSPQTAIDSSIGLEIQRNFEMLQEIVDPAIPEKLHSTTQQYSTSPTESSISTPLPGEHFHYSAHSVYPCTLKKDGTFKFDGQDVRCDAATLPNGKPLALKDQGIDIVRGPKCSCDPTPEAYCKYAENAIMGSIPGALVITYTQLIVTPPYFKKVTVDVSACYNQGPFRCDIIDKVPQPGGCGGTTTTSTTTTTTTKATAR